MKAAEHRPRAAAAGRANGQARLPRGSVRARNAPQSRSEQKSGGYRRVEVFLALEAAIALRQLMRDGRSAREVIEALLLAEKQRRKEHA